MRVRVCVRVPYTHYITLFLFSSSLFVYTCCALTHALISRTALLFGGHRQQPREARQSKQSLTPPEPLLSLLTATKQLPNNCIEAETNLYVQLVPHHTLTLFASLLLLYFCLLDSAYE